MFKLFRGSQKPKIFVIGLNKCGTSSIHGFFLANGIKSAHWAHRGVVFAATMALNISKGRPVLRGIDHFSAYSDLCLQTNFAWIEAASFFRDFHREYPDAYFLYNDRSVEKWIASRKKHPDLLKRAKVFWNCDESRVEEIWRTMYLDHKSAVLSYFTGNDRFLHFDIERDPAEKLVEFFKTDYRLDPHKYVHRKISAEKNWS